LKLKGCQIEELKDAAAADLDAAEARNGELQEV
jgi:hypothetical protein